MRELQELYLKHKDKGLVIVGLNVADDKQTALEFIADNHVTFPNALDNSDAAMMVYREGYLATGVPASYLIGRDGEIVDAWPGYQAGHPRAKAVLKGLGINLP